MSQATPTGMLLARLATASIEVAATRARGEKVSTLAALLAEAEPDEIAIAVALLTGEPRQGRIGVGWSTLSDVDAEHAAEPSVTVLELDEALTRLRDTTGPGSQSERSEQLRDLFGRLTNEEADLVARLLVGELRQGALAGLMADAVGRTAGLPATLVRRAAMLSGDLPEVAAIAVGAGRAGLEAVGLTVGRGIQPMLASTATGVAEALAACGPSSVEWKLDGIRVQVHRRGDEVAIFTRNLNDITDRVPEIVSVVRSLPVDEVVLDGEAIGVSGDDPEAFQDTMSRLGREGVDHPVSLSVSFFDCLHLDGVDLIDNALIERLDALERAAGAHRIPARIDPSETEAAAVLEDALAAGHEGVMVKALDSLYAAGRRGKAWRKVKPVETLDLAVIAAEWGHGRRTGWLSNLHLGARGDDGELVMVGKTFKGLTDELLRRQTEDLLAREVRREGITVWVRPELVVEVALDGVQRSTRYPGGVALRFARVRRYRDDKSLSDVDHIDTVRALGSVSGGDDADP